MLIQKRKSKRRTRGMSANSQTEQLEVRKVLSAVTITADVDHSATDAHREADANNDYRSMGNHLSSGQGVLVSSAENLIVGNGVDRIVNGTQTNDFKEVGIVNNGCTGSLIAPNAVLTAAHCVTPGQPATFDLNGTTYHSSKVVVHPDYNSQDIDLAIIILDQPVEGVTPAAINRTPPQVGQLLTLVGYGGTGNGNTGHNGDFGVKNIGTTPIDEVTATHVNWNFDNNSESNTAPGDSGGPAFVEVDGKFYIAGVTSGGTKEDASIGDYSFDTRVDPFAAWIDSVVGTSDTGGGGNGGGEEEGGNGGGGNEGGGGGTQTTGDGNAVTFTNDTNVAIPSDQVATVTSQVNATGLDGKITDVNVTLGIQHTYNGDLDVVLISPSGTRIDMFYFVGEDTDNFTNTVLDDDATQFIENAAAPFSGEFVPFGDLNDLNGEDPNGTWTLEVTDTFEEDGGQITSFAVTITTDAETTDPNNETGGTDGGTGDSLAQLAVQVDTEQGLYFTGNHFENWGGKGEKWMMGDNGWFFITPDGSLYQWNNTGTDGTLVATFDASFHADPSLLYDAADTATDSPNNSAGTDGNNGASSSGDLAQKAIDVDTQHELESADDDYLDWGGRNEKWMIGNQGWYFITPDGSFYQWDGGNEATGTLIETFDSQYYDDTSLLFNAADNQRSAVASYAETDAVFSSLEEDDDLFTI